MENYLVSVNTDIREVLKKLESLSQKIVYVTDSDQRVIGSITDGDIRRYAVKNGNVNGTAKDCMHTPCYVCHSPKEGIRKIHEYQIVNIPLVNDTGKILDIITPETVQKVTPVNNEFRDIKVVMMAGGKGERLYPFTSVLPKPLIPISGIPIAERILMRFKEAGLSSFVLSLNYKKNLIKTYFDDAMNDCNFEYVEETEPLGTGGSLRLMKDILPETFIVINCDMLIDVDLNELLTFHKEHNAMLTIVAAKKSMEIPYGVLHLEGDEVSSMEEKPTIETCINTGMYVVSKEAFDIFPKAPKFHMTDLCEEAVKQHRKICAFTIGNDDYMDMGVFSELKNMSEKVR